MEAMREYPDKYFDLAVVDPPYGGGFIDDPRGHMSGGAYKRYGYGQTATSSAENGGGLVGGLGEYKGAITGRFGGLFEKYHLGIEDGRGLDDEVSASRRGYL